MKPSIFLILEMPTSTSQLLHQNEHLDILKDPPCAHS
uniref:Uncharacterized protein n=1 Tax=Arundo donax TaxID=35708 RepID=A0A0A9GQ67_ARUDO